MSRKPMVDDATFAPPMPRSLYVHDDLSDEVQRQHGTDSAAFRLTQELLELLRHDEQRVVILTVEEQIAQVRERGSHAPFAMTACIGRAGEHVAEQLHERTGWFPARRRVDVAREENGAGGYNLMSTAARPLEAQLQGLEAFPSLAVVDDTLFSGLTMRTILRTLPAEVLARTHAFCLRCVAETLPSITALCPVTAGFEGHGRILDEISLINASGLVKHVAIRRAGRSPLAFFERPAWMRAWFPGYADDVIALCRRLNKLLEQDTPLA